jgi:integrase/recombinase XerD
MRSMCPPGMESIFESMPVPEAFLDVLDLVHGIREGHTKGRLWGWTRKTGYNHITAVMKKAALSGPQATPKGLRHGYAVACIEKGIQLNIVQELLGHAQMTTTAIYAHAVGAERRGIVAHCGRLDFHTPALYDPAIQSSQHPQLRTSAHPLIL